MGSQRGREEEEEGDQNTKKKDKEMTKRRSGGRRRDAVVVPEPWEPWGAVPPAALGRGRGEPAAVGESPGARRGPESIA